MGAKASKPAQSATRKFPTRAPGSAVPPPPPPRAPPAGSSRTSGPRASFAKDDAIRADGINPDPNPLEDAAFSSRLKRMGVATPNPTFSNSSIANPYAPPPSSSASSSPSSQYPAPSSNRTLGVLEARRRLQDRAQAELENPGSSSSGGREFLDAGTVRHILSLRAAGAPAAEIESRLRLKSGVVARLGRPGVVVPLAADGGGRT